MEGERVCVVGAAAILKNTLPALAVYVSFGTSVAVSIATGVKIVGMSQRYCAPSGC